jgi:hypothetical protein
MTPLRAALWRLENERLRLKFTRTCPYLRAQGYCRECDPAYLAAESAAVAYEMALAAAHPTPEFPAQSWA